MSYTTDSPELDAKIEAAIKNIDNKYQRLPEDHPSHPRNHALLIAVRRSDFEATRTAIANGAKIRKLSGILEAAITGDPQDMRVLTLLLQKGARDIPKGGVLTKAAVKGRVYVLHYLLRRGFSPALGLAEDEAERYGVQGVEGIEGLANTLVAATLARQTDAVKTLLDFAKVRGKVVYPYEVWEKAVMIAAENNDEKTEKALLEAEEKIYGTQIYLRAKEFVQSTATPGHRNMPAPKSILKKSLDSANINSDAAATLSISKSCNSANINADTAATINDHQDGDDHVDDDKEEEYQKRRRKLRIALRQSLLKRNEDRAKWVVVTPDETEDEECDYVVINDDSKDDFVLV
ncbi:hypothetical protein FPQ18DRAFT_388932 [Pyronema domesticum]|uniref:Uncharacterized protein n=1 Tax=Pyronema omphalodes (strain CBS 100304) TaxID=1076935 RepID=U4LEE0_PYROM|nr:hypothetical protein FPQ18DRAFT_388932 [Pyronema domesticum]CCX09654.1 Protein of unknown function [Pyronema omphalodes CBS 100304]